MDLTDDELTLLLNNLLDDAQDKITHGLDEYDADQKAAFYGLSKKAYAEARARKKVRPDVFWWVSR
jgi:hypothetical protein